MEDRLHTIQKSTTMGNAVFLLLSFPLGLVYFLIVVIGFSLGVGTLVLWVGLPIIFATVVLIRGMATIEQHMVTSLLHIPIAQRTPRRSEAQRGFLRDLGDMLCDPFTWTRTIYMLLKLPLGIVSFTLTLVLPIVSIAVTCMPVAYLINLLVNLILLKNGIHSNGEMIPYFIEVGEHFDLTMFVRSFVGVPIGFVLCAITFFLLGGLARFSGELARAMLGPREIGREEEPSEQEWASPSSYNRPYSAYEEQYATQEARSFE